MTLQLVVVNGGSGDQRQRGFGEQAAEALELAKRIECESSRLAHSILGAVDGLAKMEDEELRDARMARLLKILEAVDNMAHELELTSGSVRSGDLHWLPSVIESSETTLRATRATWKASKAMYAEAHEHHVALHREESWRRQYESGEPCRVDQVATVLRVDVAALRPHLRNAVPEFCDCEGRPYYARDTMERAIELMQVMRVL